MSASKKKRLGSQRRSLNPNVQDSPETSDQAMGQPAQGRQRADANADLNPDSAQSETSARKKKLGSQRGNKGTPQFKDVTPESRNKPIEEVEDSKTHSQTQDSVGSPIKNDSIDESLERNITSTFPESEAAGFDLALNDASNLSFSTITKVTPQISDIQNTNMDTTSDLLLNVAQSEKNEIASTEEGVLSEKDQAQQMPGIFEATTLAGVTGESTSSDRLIEHEEINIIGSHDYNKHNTEDKAGPIEKPVCQESDKSSLPTAKARKMGSSRRKKVTDLKELQYQDKEIVVQSNTSNALETTGLTIVDTTEGVNVSVSATGVTYKEEGQVEKSFSPKVNKEKMDTDDLSDVPIGSLSADKEFEEPHMENLLVEGDLIDVPKLSDEQLVCLQNKDLSELSFVEIPPTNDTNAPVMSSPHFVSGITVEDVEEAKILETGENSTLQVCNESDETLEDITNKEPLKTTEFTTTLKDDLHPKDDVSFDYFTPDKENKKGSEKEGKDETLVGCNLYSELFPELESDKSSVPELQFTKDETVTELCEPMLSAQPEIPPSTEGLLCLDKNEEYNLPNYSADQAASSSVCVTPGDNSSVQSGDGKNVIEQPEPLISFIDVVNVIPDQLYKDQNKDDTAMESIGANKNEPVQTKGVHQQTFSSVSETFEDKISNFIGLTDLDETKLVFKTNTENVESINLLGQQSEPVTLTDGVSTDSCEPYNQEDQDEKRLSHEQLVDLQEDMSSESERSTNPHTEEINAHLTSPFPNIAANVNDVTATWDVQGRNQEVIITPDTTIDEIQVVPVLEEQSTETSMYNKGHTAGPDIIDKAPVQVQNESNDNEDLKYTSKPKDETDIEDIKDISDTQQFSEPQVYNETMGKPVENVQNLDVEVNAPDTDAHHDPVKRKFGSSRRLKPRNDVTKVTTVDNDDALSTEDKNLPFNVDVQTDEQSEQIKKEENVGLDNEVDAAAARELSSPNEEMEVDQMKEKIFEVEANSLGLDKNAVKIVEDGISQPSEVDKDEKQLWENDEMKAQRDENDVVEETLLKKAEPVQSSEIDMGNENQAAVEDKSDKSFIQVHDETLETDIITNDELIKSTEVTDPNPSTESKDNTEQCDTKTESYALKDTINVHQLTYISDSETHEEMDNLPFQQAKQPVLEENIGEPSENVQLMSAGVNTSDSDSHHGMRRKLGSSRRVKGRKLEGIPTLPNDNENSCQVPELVEACSVVSELEAEPMNQGNFTKPEDTKFLSDKESVDSTQENEIKTQDVSFDENTITDIQQEVPEVVVDSFTIKDLNDKGIVEEEGLQLDIDNTSSQRVAGSEDIISAKLDDAMQSAVMSVEDITQENEKYQVMEVSETSAKVQLDSESKRRKLGSTRRSQLNRKPQDEERNAEDNAAILVKATKDEKDNSQSVSEEDAQPSFSDLLVNQGESTIAADHDKDQYQHEESTEKPEVTQEEKEKILQTEAELVVDVDEGAVTQTLLPIAGEEIQPSSPGKRRKMGSTRKNLSSKKESPQEDIVIPVNSEREVDLRISNDNDESKEQVQDLHAYTATVHQAPSDEETPLSPQVSQEKLRSQSKETELSSQHEAMAEDAAVARRRKMGSHRKPHSDQSIMQSRVKESEESLLHPLGGRRAESPNLTQISEVNKGDNKASSSATAFNVKLNSRPLSEKISEQPPLPSINVRRVQQSNIRISTGYEPSASRYEVVMIGDSSVGKTSFIQRAQSGKFSSDVPASVGMDSYKWTVVVNGKTVVLHLWDTAGQERFRSMTKQIFHRAQAFLLMYDVTCAQTFTAVSYWANCIKDGAPENAVVLLLGNKSDRTERKVRREEGEILAEENSFTFMECSAATGENVIEALETVARLLSQKAVRSEEPLSLRTEPKSKFGCC